MTELKSKVVKLLLFWPEKLLCFFACICRIIALLHDEAPSIGFNGFIILLLPLVTSDVPLKATLNLVDKCVL